MTRSKLMMITVGFSVALLLGLGLAPSPANAQGKGEVCDNGQDDDGDKAIDCEDEDCKDAPECGPTAKGFCHNIGGPDALGANCDPETGACSVTDQETGVTYTALEDEFFGHVIGTDSPNAILAHIKHGDGPVVEFIEPTLHLASQGDNHKASNVNCIGIRVIEQPDEPGN